MRDPDLRVRFVVEIEPMEFYDSKLPGAKKSSRRYARDWRRHLDRAVREALCLGLYSRAVKVYMVNADTGERIS
jgi:hypothetical protein